ncbi:MAG: hypothetical protein AAGA60_29845, partial [Cyanobacteria bacterium P01_E01_bin.42]
MENLSERKFISTEIIALVCGISAIAFAPILIKISSAELGANAIMFHRFWVATLVLGVWNRIDRQPEEIPEEGTTELQSKMRENWSLLLGAGIADAACMVSWAWSIE